jgi:hypothetical protein
MTTPLACPKCGADLRLSAGAAREHVCPRCEYRLADSESNDLAEVLPAEPEEEIGQVIAVDEPAPSRSRRRREEPDDAMIWWVAYRTTGMTVRKGIAVLRPRYVAFVPTADQVNVLGSMAGQVAMSMAHVHVISLDWLRRKRNIPEIVEGLWDEYRAEFDDYLREFVGESGGEVWTREECKVTHVPSKRATGKHGVTIRKDTVELQGATTNGQALARLFQGWEHAAASVRTAVLLSLCLSVIPGAITIIALIWHLTGDMPLAAVIVWTCFTALAWAPALIALIKKGWQKPVGHHANGDG